MNKKLTDDELEELKELIKDKHKVATVVAILGAIATVVSAIGTAAASIVLALKNKG